VSDQLGKILKTTLTAIESGKEEIFFIAETSRSETQRLTNELSQLKSDIAEVIPQVDFQEKLDRRLRQKLMEVSRSYNKYTEKEMIAAYAEAKDAQVNLQLLQSRESQLRKRRDDIERSLRQMQATIERAENLMTQVNMAVNLLQGGIAEVLHTQNHEQRQEMGLRVIRAQEEERRRVAREIHDGPAQTLANIVLRLEIAEKLLEIDPSRVKAELKDLKNLVRSNLQDIRRIIFDLRPMALDDLGIVPAIAKYLDYFQENYGIICELQIEGREKRLLPAMEVALFRLIQEGMTNVAKHAQSVKADVSLVFQENWTIARIQDYGRGFEVNSVLDNPGEHFGLIGIRERVEMFAGRFSVQSTLEKGTTIELSIPSRHEEEEQHDSDRNCR
jgi:two-component system sensor histidine kinase DegS